MKNKTACAIKALSLTAIIAVSVSAWFAPAQTMQQAPRTYSFYSRVGGEWLKVERVNQTDDPDGFHPCYTHVTSQYKPVARKLGDNRWEIVFTSEIAEDLP